MKKIYCANAQASNFLWKNLTICLRVLHNFIMDKKEISDSKSKLSFRAGWTIKLLWATIVLCAVVIPLILAINHAPSGLVALIAIVGLFVLGAVFICCAVFYVMWLHAAAKNKFLFNKDGFIYDAKTGRNTFMMTPAWTVAWNFIPIVNFFMSYIAMKQILFATKSKAYNSPDEDMKFIKWWWAMYILSNVVSSAVGLVFCIVYAVMTAKLVKKITDLQTARLDALAADCESVSDSDIEVIPDSPQA